jgi:hypothetical protein
VDKIYSAAALSRHGVYISPVLERDKRIRNSAIGVVVGGIVVSTTSRSVKLSQQRVAAGIHLIMVSQNDPKHSGHSRHIFHNFCSETGALFRSLLTENSRFLLSIGHSFAVLHAATGRSEALSVRHCKGFFSLLFPFID